MNVVINYARIWPWLHDLDTWPSPRYPEDVPAHQNCFYSQVRAQRGQTDVTKRITTRHFRLAIRKEWICFDFEMVNYFWLAHVMVTSANCFYVPLSSLVASTRRTWSDDCSEAADELRWTTMRCKSEAQCRALICTLHNPRVVIRSIPIGRVVCRPVSSDGLVCALTFESFDLETFAVQIHLQTKL